MPSQKGIVRGEITHSKFVFGLLVSFSIYTSSQFQELTLFKNRAMITLPRFDHYLSLLSS